jgi:hypothetical protein
MIDKFALNGIMKNNIPIYFPLNMELTILK